MASKKQLHIKSRIPGIENDKRIQNKWNAEVIKELLKSPLGLTPKYRQPKTRLSISLRNKALRVELGYDSIEDLPEELRIWPHKNRRPKKDSLMNQNYKILVNLGYKSKKTKIKEKIKKVERFLECASAKQNKIHIAYKKAEKMLSYKVDEKTKEIKPISLFETSINFSNQVAKIKRFIRINIKTINYAKERWNYCKLQGAT